MPTPDAPVGAGDAAPTLLMLAGEILRECRDKLFALDRAETEYNRAKRA